MTLTPPLRLCRACTAVVDNNYDDNGILASITLPTADGIKCDYHVLFFCMANDNAASTAVCVIISNVER